MNALLHGDLRVLGRPPGDGALSLLVCLPFAALAHGGSPIARYEWGVVPCVFSVGLLGVWLAGLARTRGVRPPGQVAIVALGLALASKQWQ